MKNTEISGYYTVTKGEFSSVIKILVSGTEGMKSEAVTVCADIPNDALKHDMISEGSAISWSDEKVFIEIEGVEGIPFKKVGDVRKDEAVFHEYVKHLEEVKSKRGRG